MLAVSNSSLVPFMVSFAGKPTVEVEMDLEGYVTILEASKDERVPFTVQWLGRLAKNGKIKAVKLGEGRRGVWLIHLESLLEYISEMEKLGANKYNPS